MESLLRDFGGSKTKMVRPRYENGRFQAGKEIPTRGKKSVRRPQKVVEWSRGDISEKNNILGQNGGRDDLWR